MEKKAAVALRYVAAFATVFIPLLVIQLHGHSPKTLTDLWVAAVAAFPFAIEKFLVHPQ